MERAERIAADRPLEIVRRELDARSSDHRSFADVGFDVLHLTTGRTSHYHTPRDTSDAIDWKGLERVARYLTALVSALGGTSQTE
jgi:Zn-dependent M28 family amino/carboxypeptidase